MVVAGLKKRKWAKHKKVAQRHANFFRRQGYKARVIKQTGASGGYAVYSDTPH